MLSALETVQAACACVPAPKALGDGAEALSKLQLYASNVHKAWNHGIKKVRLGVWP